MKKQIITLFLLTGFTSVLATNNPSSNPLPQDIIGGVSL
jgi:hypothetical protein